MTQRLIFTDQELTKEEQQHERSFTEYCELNELPIPDYYKTNEHIMLRYLQATKFDYSKTHPAMMAHHQWMSTANPHLEPTNAVAIKLIQSGFMYLLKRDKDFRPVLVVNVSILKNFTPEDFENTQAVANFMCTYAINHIMLPGQAEAFTTIIDLQHVSFYQIPVKGLKTIVGAMQTNFRGRAFRTYILHANMLFRGSWGVVKQMLDEFTAQKIHMLGKNYKEEMAKLIPPTSLEQKYGGLIPDKKDGFWPPDMAAEGDSMLTREEYQSAAAAKRQQ